METSWFVRYILFFGQCSWFSLKLNKLFSLQTKANVIIYNTHTCTYTRTHNVYTYTHTEVLYTELKMTALCIILEVHSKKVNTKSTLKKRHFIRNKVVLSSVYKKKNLNLNYFKSCSDCLDTNLSTSNYLTKPKGCTIIIIFNISSLLAGLYVGCLTRVRLQLLQEQHHSFLPGCAVFFMCPKQWPCSQRMGF